jgi:hypothetical protein
MPAITGACFCGNIRYHIRESAVTATVCHCAGCRRASGAPAVAWVTVPADAFELLQGELRTVRGRATEPGTCDSCGGVRGFCPACGTHITFVGDDRPTEIDITTGSLDDPDRFLVTET